MKTHRLNAEMEYIALKIYKSGENGLTYSEVKELNREYMIKKKELNCILGLNNKILINGEIYDVEEGVSNDCFS